jgi:hypothetical protein
MIGLRYARLTVLRDAGIQKSRGMVLCRCDCGAEKVIEARRVRKGLTKSCGCLSRQMSKARYLQYRSYRNSSPLDAIDEDIIQ